MADRPDLRFAGAGRSDYLAILQGLLPRGMAWPRDPDAVLTAVLDGLAAELARHHGRTEDLLYRESWPPSALEMLADWERVLGLPDICMPAVTALEERRAHVISRLRARGGQSIAYFTGIALDLGYPVQVQEFRPFRCGFSRCGDVHRVGSAEMRAHWRITVPGPRITPFRAGLSRCGVDPLGKIDRAEDLECVVRRLAPAHTQLDIAYQGS